MELGGFSISAPFKISKVQIFGAPQAPLVGEIDICAHGLFCTKLNSTQLLFEQFFYIIGNLCSVQPENESTFPFQYNIIFETYQSFKSPISIPGGDRHVTPLLFCKKFNAQILLFKTFSDIIGNFRSVQPKSELLSHFSTI